MSDNIYKIDSIFPIPLYSTVLPSKLSKYTNILKEIGVTDYPNDLKEQNVAKDFGYRSLNTYILHNPQLTPLASWIMSHFQHYAENILDMNIGKLGFSQSWISRKSQNQQHILHHHPNSVISGVFYFNKDSNITPLQIERPVYQKYHPHFHFESKNQNSNQFSTEFVDYCPQPLELVIFPSWLRHGVRANDNSNVRDSLAINSFPANSVLGNEDSLTELDFSKLYIPPPPQN